MPRSGTCGGPSIRITTTLPPHAKTGFVVLEEDGRTGHHFEADGRHLDTFDALTGVVTWTMAYDAATGGLQSVTDAHGLATTIERAPGGTPTAIVGPYGHRTELTVGPGGWLERIEDPGADAWQTTIRPDGLMTSWSDRTGNTSTFGWDAMGRLESHIHPGGGEMTFVRSELPDGADVTKVSPMGRMTTYGYELGEDLIEDRTVTLPNGATSSGARTGADVTVGQSADGTVVQTTKGPDPRFKMQTPVLLSSVVTLPSGLTRTTTGARTVVLGNPTDIFSMTSQTDTSTTDGRTWTKVYDVGSRSETTTSPAGRVSQQVLDALGNVVEIQRPDVFPITLVYDDNGRLETTTQGTRVTSRAYGTDGLVAGITDPLIQTTAFARDAKGVVTAETRPDLAVTAFGFDADNRTTSVVPPSQPAHAFTYGVIGALTSYDPPATTMGPTPTTYSYDLDKVMDQMVQPGPRVVDYGHDFAGRLEAVTFPMGVVTREYDVASGRLATLTGPAGVTLAYTFDGQLPASVVWSGDVAGTVAWTYDTAFRLSAESVNAANTVTFAYEADDLLTQAGPLTLTRDPESGRLAETSAGIVSDLVSYSDYGERSVYTAEVGGVPAISFSYERDDLGRITSQTETLAGISTTYAYSYDSIGRLRFVTEGTSVLESYEYDPNGNRVSSTNGGGVFAATVDDQDRLLTYGDIEYAWTENGELENRFDTGTGELTDFVYDAVGNLRSVTLPDATQLDYVVDGEGRRVGRVVDGTFERGWLWNGTLRPVAELDGAGVVAKRFVYAEGANVPEVMVTGAGTYRLINDHLGSVRLVVDVGTGVIAQELSYDAWGRVLTDTNPGFQPFGFAGGLYDADTGLVRFGVRDYDPEAGRWTAKDPLRFDQSGGPNLYLYVAGDPVNFRDPEGKDLWGMSDAEWFCLVNPGLCILLTIPGCNSPPSPPPPPKPKDPCVEARTKCDNKCLTEFGGIPGVPIIPLPGCFACCTNHYDQCRQYGTVVTGKCPNVTLP